MVDVSVASKYGSDLTWFMQVMLEDMLSMFDVLKQDLSNSLPKQVRALVQQINDVTQGKCIEGMYVSPNPKSPVGQGNAGMLANVNQPNSRVNLNLQQPFYQTMAYGANMSLTGSGMPHGPVSDVMFPWIPAPKTYQIGTDRAHGGTD
jgi:hypothetical protein